MEFDIDRVIIEEQAFMSQYLNLLVYRLSNPSMSRKDKFDYNILMNRNAVSDDCLLAFEKLLGKIDAKLDEKLIVEVANTVNRSSMYVSNVYRKIGHFMADTDIPISESNMIEKDVLLLLYKYDNLWDELNYLEREALFNIEFVRIHPFEDGNKRTSRLLNNYNLLKQGKVPVVFDLDLLSEEEYLDVLKNKDVSKLVRLFYEQSKREVDIINYLYNEYRSNKKCHQK